MCVSIAVVGGKLIFLPGRLRDFWHCIFHRSFCFLGANYCNLFCDCSSFGRGFCSWGWVSSFLFKSRWFRSWSWESLLIRHCSHCLVKIKEGRSFGFFSYDSFVSFRAIGVIWGTWELTAELVCLLFWTICLIPYPVGPIIKTTNTIYRGPSGSRAGCAGLTNMRDPYFNLRHPRDFTSSTSRREQPCINT